MSELNSNNTSANNKRIAKNTILLYIRMAFTMSVSLYTSRVILQVLGVEDFGIYNVVGGIVTMFCFFNGGLISATQRYITYNIGKGSENELKKVFSTSIQIHALLSLIIFLLAETVGLWFLFEKMVIPENRFIPAVWVYQCSIITAIFNFMSVPFNATIIAHEKMSAFAYISVAEVILKLVVLYLLFILPGDNLINYAILILLIQIAIRFLYANYCHKHFKETFYENKINKELFKEMSSFAGWSFWGNIAGILNTQGLNMMLNVFYGPITNAARGISVQVQGAVQQFVTNFQMALNPQITKNYAVGNLSEMHKLMYRSARFSFFLLFAISLPIIVESDYILHLWLGNVPENSVIFTQLTLCISLLFTIANPCVIANQATGKVKKYQTVVGGTLMTILPISYLVLKFGAPVYSVFIVHLIVEMTAQLLRIIMLRKQINISLRHYFCEVYVPILIVIISSLIIPLYLKYAIHDGGFGTFILISLSCFLSSFICIIILGLSNNERSFLLNKALHVLNKK